MTEHYFAGLVYDVNTMLLTAKMYVYGYKRDNVPTDYKPIFQPNKVETKNNNKGSNIYSEPFYSFVNTSDSDDINVSESNSQLVKYYISTWIFATFVRLMYSNFWI